MNFLLLLGLLVGADGGVPPATPPVPEKVAPKKDDAEVVKNLELLELMDESNDLELLQELAVER